MKSKAEAGDQAGPDKSLPDTIRQDAEIHAAALKQQRELKIHPACLIFPDMSQEDYERLKADIGRIGVIEPIKFWDEQLLEGRHRHKVCNELGILCPVWYISEDEMGDWTPTQYVIAANLSRRHLTKAQRAAIAVEYLSGSTDAGVSPDETTLSAHGQSGEEKPDSDSETRAAVFDRVPKQTAGSAAEAVGVARTSVQRAKAVKEKNPTAFAAVKAGTMSLAEAEADVILDGQGEPVTIPNLRDVFLARVKLKKAMSHLTACTKILNGVFAGQQGTERLTHAKTTQKIGYARTEIQAAMPYVPCPDCEGQTPERCTRCTGRGWQTQSEVEGDASDGAGGAP